MTKILTVRSSLSTQLAWTRVAGTYSKAKPSSKNFWNGHSKFFCFQTGSKKIQLLFLRISLLFDLNFFRFFTSGRLAVLKDVFKGADQ